MSILRKTETTITEPLTGFGELSTAVNRPYIQATAVYDLIPANFREYSSGSGSTGANDGMFEVSTGVDVGAYGTIQSFRAVNYKAGESGLTRFTALFTSGVANSWQAAGLFTIGDELSFGYDGIDFGIFHRRGGKSEVREITVTGGASGSETLTLTLNGVGYSIDLTSGTTNHNAHEIESWLNANQSVWHAEQVGSAVTVTALSDSAKNGAYSYSSSTSTGTISQVKAGVTKTTTHIPESNWNGTSISGLDPTKGNVYQIRYQYLGFGGIFFDVEDPETGKFVTVHVIKYSNANISPSLGNPSMHTGLYAVSLGSTTNLTVKSGSMAAFVQGLEGRTRNPRAYENTQTIGTTEFTNILTIRNTRTYNGNINQQEIQPDEVTIANESGKNCMIEIRSAGTFSGDTDFFNIGNNLLADADISSVGVSNGRLLFSTVVAGGGSIAVNLREFRIRIPPTLTLSIAAELTSGASAPVTASLVWYEDI